MNLYFSTFLARLKVFCKLYTTHFFVFVGGIVGLWQLLPAETIMELYQKYPLLLSYKTEIGIFVAAVAYYKVRMTSQNNVEIPPTASEVKKVINEAEANRL